MNECSLLMTYWSVNALCAIPFTQLAHQSQRARECLHDTSVATTPMKLISGGFERLGRAELDIGCRKRG